MKLAIAIFLFAVLVIPLSLLTCLVWLFGGWRYGWDYMPNPVNAFMDWLDL